MHCVNLVTFWGGGVRDLLALTEFIEYTEIIKFMYIHVKTQGKHILSKLSE
jgi:hypothetical protein